MADAPVLAYVGLGANLGDAGASLTAAFASLAQLPRTRLLRSSHRYVTAPVDAKGPDYLNAVAGLATSLAPLELLAQLQRIEAAHGRERPYRNAPRTLDLDLLLYGDESLSEPALTVPHPRMHQRAFVLVPLSDVAPPGLVIPGLGPLENHLAAVAGQRIQKLET